MKRSCTAIHLTSAPWLSCAPSPSSLKAFLNGSLDRRARRELFTLSGVMPCRVQVLLLYIFCCYILAKSQLRVAQPRLNYASRRQARIAADCPNRTISPQNCTRNDLRRSKMQKISWRRAPSPPIWLASALSTTAAPYQIEIASYTATR